ncbi:MAG: VCBS repeat-containing protein [Maribacter sp.]|nr:VCBS repeat-containing protein [Maribacter sp.]
MRKLNLKPFGHLFLFLYLPMVLVSCAEKEKKQEETVLSGKQLLDIQCASCHLTPKPETLDKTTWKLHVLPRMGYMMGFRNQPKAAIGAFNDEGEGERIGEETSLYLATKTPSFSQENWQKLQEYILNLAPEKLPVGESKIEAYTKLFEAQKVEMPFPRPSTTFTGFISPGHLISGDSNNDGIIMHYDANLNVRKQDSVGINLVHAKKYDGKYWLTHMGTSFAATDNPNGFISQYSENGGVEKVVENLTRPVHTAFGDLSGNGETELLVSEFGKWTGRLSWYKKENGKYVGKDLISLPGAIRSEIADMNGDGLNDVIALFGQGDEAVYILYNQGNGKFNIDKVLQFPPTYGSTYFKMIDYNKDGFLDILYTAGDNGDYTPIAKPYHGIRVFTNDGQNRFKEKLFLPLYGAFRAIAEDFDQDGDLDFAAISYFPKYNKEFFVFRENLGNNWFMPKIVKDVNIGRWMTMDSFDYDDDGDLDLVLGSYDWEQNSVSKEDIVPLVYLRNTLIE